MELLLNSLCQRPKPLAAPMIAPGRSDSTRPCVRIERRCRLFRTKAAGLVAGIKNFMSNWRA